MLRVSISCESHVFVSFLKIPRGERILFIKAYGEVVCSPSIETKIARSAGSTGVCLCCCSSGKMPETPLIKKTSMTSLYCAGKIYLNSSLARRSWFQDSLYFISTEQHSKLQLIQASTIVSGTPQLMIFLFCFVCFAFIAKLVCTRIVKRQRGLDKVLVEWPDVGVREHELHELKPAPVPGTVLKFPNEEVELLEYTKEGEAAHIARPRENIPKDAPVCGHVAHTCRWFKYMFWCLNTYVLVCCKRMFWFVANVCFGVLQTYVLVC